MTDTTPWAPAVSMLTTDWNSVLSPQETGRPGYQTVDYEPLIDMLRQALHSSTGKTESGRSDAAARNVINVAAFDLWQRIDGTARAWIGDLSKERPAGELKDAITQLNRILDTLWRANQIEESMYFRIGNLFSRWRDDIWALFDPPVTKEIKAACPNCGETHSYDTEGGRSSAITAYYWKGVQPQAQCRRCGQSWGGEKELLELGYSVRATVDEGTLREMGVI